MEDLEDLKVEGLQRLSSVLFPLQIFAWFCFSFEDKMKSLASWNLKSLMKRRPKNCVILKIPHFILVVLICSKEEGSSPLYAR